MKPHTLTLRQFGPYVDHTVALDDFHDAGIFLVHGDTGAGKSTLLDAMSWALYGSGLGDRTGDEMLRNAGAPADAAMEVTLDFSLGDRRYRVSRTAEPERVTRRGAVARARSTASLQCLAGDPRFQPVSGSKDVTAEVVRLLCLPHEQFSRVIVLPQGEFRDLLLASAKQREQLLERLFGTERYARLEGHLRAMDQSARADFDRADGVVKALLDGVGASDLEDLDAKSESARGALAGVEAEVATTRAALDVTLAERATAREREQRNGRRRTHREAIAALDAAAPAMAGARRRLERDASAARCAGLLERRRALDEALTQRRAQLAVASEARDRHAAALAHPEIAPEVLDARAAALRERVDRLARLRALSDDAARVIAREAEVTAGRLDVERRVAAMASREASLSTEAAALAEVDAAVAVHEAALAREPDLRARVEALEGRQQRHEERRAREETLVGWQRSLRTAKAAEREAEAAWREAVAAEDRARAAAMREHAVDLARALVAGEPCAVCGSREHPLPAVGAVAHAPGVDATRTTALATSLEAARREVLLAQVRVEEAEAVLRASGDAESVDPATLLAETKARREELAGLRRQRTDLAALRKRRTGMADGLARDRAAIGPEQEAVVGLRARLATVEEAAVQGRARFAGEGVAPEAVASLVASLDAEVVAETASLDAARGRREEATRRLAQHEGALPTLRAEVSAAEATHAEAAGVLDAAMREAGLDDELAVRAAVLSPVERERLAGELERHARAEATHREALAALGPDEVEGTAAAALDAREQEQRVRLDTLLRDAGTAQASLSSMEGQRRSIVAALDQRRAAEARAGQVRRVSEAANGKGPTKVRLSRYVLLDLFDRVVAGANLSLEAITDGRFRLLRHERAQTGREFDLAVEDAYVGGLPRPAASLSGGEVFLASVAMALGLGEALQAWAGGVRVESLFIDEGFGALDEDTIERTLELLERLPRHARMVGLVSHVPELRKRIPARLEVLRGDRGSYTRCSLRHRADR